jgi:hypothetical protein
VLEVESGGDCITCVRPEHGAVHWQKDSASNRCMNCTEPFTADITAGNAGICIVTHALYMQMIREGVCASDARNDFTVEFSIFASDTYLLWRRPALATPRMTVKKVPRRG